MLPMTLTVTMRVDGEVKTMRAVLMQGMLISFYGVGLDGLRYL